MRDATALKATICPEARIRCGDEGALDVAFAKIRVEYLSSLAQWRASGIAPVFHVKLTIDRVPERGGV